MEFVSGVVDYGIAPEIYVHDVERVVLISPNIVRVSLFAPFITGPQKTELRCAIHLLWDRQRFLACRKVYDRASKAVAFSENFKLRTV